MSESVMEIDGMGNKVWRNLEGEYHRTGGPAVETTNGDKCWYQNGKHHRTGGPAVETTNGHKSWYQNGQLHRTNGPAIEWHSTGYKSWYINGECLGCGDKGFWALWDLLSPEQKRDPILLSYLPGDFHV